MQHVRTSLCVRGARAARLPAPARFGAGRGGAIIRRKSARNTSLHSCSCAPTRVSVAGDGRREDVRCSRMLILTFSGAAALATAVQEVSLAGMEVTGGAGHWRATEWWEMSGAPCKQYGWRGGGRSSCQDVRDQGAQTRLPPPGSPVSIKRSVLIREIPSSGRL